MKYIVAKDGRIIKFDTSDVEEEIAGIKYDILGFRLKTIMQFYGLKKEDIVKVVDTIEELCDEFVVVNSFCCSLLNENEKQDIKRFAKSNLYGAIWTDKGLIYVAKMNNKGELELL
jgi:hypothetical protein